MDSPSRLAQTPVILLHTNVEPRNGHEQVLALARGLGGSVRFRPLVVSASPALLDAAKNEDIPCMPLKGGPFGLRDRLRLRKILQETHNAILHSQDMDAAALAYSLSRSCQWVTHVHTKRDAYPLPTGRKGRPLREAKAVVALSSAMGALLTAGGVEGGRIRIIPSGIDPGTVVKRAARDDERFIFAVLGDLTPENGHEVLIRALPLLERYDDMPDWEIRILGEGPLFNPLLELAMSLGVMGRLAILGKQRENDILPYCDCLIAPAVSAALNGEDNGEALREGWAVGLPVIASNLLAHCELARNRDNALVYPMDDPNSLAAHMADAARDPDLVKALCANGTTSLMACTATDMTAAYIALYESLLFSSKRAVAP